MNRRTLLAIALAPLVLLADALPDSVSGNGVSWARLGSLGRNDYVVTNTAAGKIHVSSVTNDSGESISASDVGALPANGTAVSAELATLAENANNARNAEWAAFARDAGNAEYASSAGGVFWFDVYGKPDWLGDEKPTYTAEEVGALPADGIAMGAQYADTAPWIGVEGRPSWIGDDKPTYTAEEVGAAPEKITLVLGGTSPNYELRLNGVAQTFEQVSNYVAHGEVVAKHLNGFYKPTYLSASEIMFDCTGFIAGDVSTRRIHMVKTDNKVALDGTKTIAEEGWVSRSISDATNALPDWTKSSSKPSYSPWEIGALGIYDMADSAWYASEAGTAYYANSVDWFNVSGRPQNIVTFDQNADDPLDTAEKILERASAGSGGNNDYFIEDRGTGFSYRIVATNGVLFAEKVEIAQ